VNLLKNYDLSRKVIYFENQVGVNAQEVFLSISVPDVPAQTTAETIKNVAVAIGSSLLTSESERKLRNASEPEKIAKGISEGVESSMIKYLRIVPTSKLTEGAEYIVTTTLEKCRMNSNADGIFLSVEAKVQIFDRNGGKLIWEYEDSETVRMRKTAISAVEDATGMSGIAQVTDLLMLSEEQIASAVKDAAMQVGRNISEVLREDFANSGR